MSHSLVASLLLSTFVGGISGAELHHTLKCPPSKTVTVTAPCTSSSQPSQTPAPGGPCLLIKPSCQLLQQASGFDLAYYSNVFGPTGFSSQVVQPETPSSYYLTENLSPLDTSVTNVTFYPQQETPPPGPYTLPVGDGYPYYEGYSRETNGGIVVNANNFTMVYSGFIRAPASGQYQLCTIGDNEADLFLGHENAFSCSTSKASAEAVPLVKGYFNEYVPTAPLIGPCATIDFVKGAFYPLRVVTGNYQGPSAFSLRLVAPGQTPDTGSRDFSGMAYPVDCGVYTGL